MSSISALRIGVVLSGTVIAEHVLRDRRPFSIGQSTRTTVSVPLTELPRHCDLLTLVEGGVQLRLPAGAQARISIGAELQTHVGEATIVVPMSARGRIELGSLRVLFQGVALPLAVAPPRLPRALQGTLADRIDKRLAVFVAASVVAHIGVMTAASLNDPPATVSMAQRATEQYQDQTLAIIDADDPILDFTSATPDQPGPAKPEPATATTPAKPEPGPSTPSAPRPPRPVDPGAIADPSTDATRYADLLFAPDGDRGKLAGDLTDRRPGTDLAQQLQEIKDADANTSIGDRTQIATRDREGSRPGTVTDPLVPGGPGAIIRSDKDDEKSPPGRIKPLPPKRVPDGPDVESIIRKISTTYVGGLQRCYKKSLVGDAKLAGKIILTFSVTDRGALTDGGAAGVDDALEQCVEGLMKTWSFTPVVDADGDATDVDLRLPLQLTPT